MFSRPIAAGDTTPVSIKDAHASTKPSNTVPAPIRIGRWTTRLFAVALVAVLISVLSGTETFGQRVTAMAWEKMSGENEPVSSELTFKMALAQAKYGTDAAMVSEMYGTDAAFQRVLRIHGEQVVPVIAFFVHTDLRSMRAQYGIAKLMAVWKRMWPRKSEEAELPNFEEYSPHFRGLYAVDQIDRDGHDFLGQFDIHKDGKAKWNQTERLGEAIIKFLLNGIRNVERKRNTGEHITSVDWASAGADVLVIFSVPKVLKVLKIPPSKTAQSIDRVQQMGKSVLARNSLGTTIFSYGARAGALYLVAAHPSLLTGLFVDIGQALGISEWLAVGLGWFAVVLLMSFLLLPLLAAASFLIPVVRLISQAAQWLQPAPRIFGRGAAPSKAQSS